MTIITLKILLEYIKYFCKINGNMYSIERKKDYVKILLDSSFVFVIYVYLMKNKLCDSKALFLSKEQGIET